MTHRGGNDDEDSTLSSPDAFDSLRRTLAEDVPAYDGTPTASESGGLSEDSLDTLTTELVGDVVSSYRAGDVSLDVAESQLRRGVSILARETVEMPAEPGSSHDPLSDAGIDATSLIEVFPTPAFVIDADHTVLAYNERLAELLGIDPTDEIGSDSQLITTSAYTDERREMILAEKVLEAPRTADEKFDVERVDSQDIYTGDYVYHDTSVLRNQRGEEIDIAFVAVPLFDSDGTLRAVLELVEHTGQTLEEFPGLASVVSHDIRNPLSVVGSYVELAEEDIDDEYYEAITHNIDRIENIIDDVMTLAEGANDDPSTETVDLSDAAQRVWASLETGDAALETTAVTVMAAPAQLDRLLENLLRNSLEHGGDGVTIRVGPLEDGFYVADDGPGIPPEERDAVFEHGYTTTDTGTGFGLPIVHMIACNHDWDISITESVDGGARFDIRTGRPR